MKPLGIIAALQLVLVFLKLTQLIGWSWWVILSPFILIFILAIGMLLMARYIKKHGMPWK